MRWVLVGLTLVACAETSANLKSSQEITARRETSEQTSCPEEELEITHVRGVVLAHEWTARGCGQVWHCTALPGGGFACRLMGQDHRKPPPADQPEPSGVIER